MSANHPAISNKRKARPGHDGGYGISRGRLSGIESIRISNPFIHPLDMDVSLDAAASGHRKKRPRFTEIRRAQLPAFTEQSRQKAAARKAGEYYLNHVST